MSAIHTHTHTFHSNESTYYIKILFVLLNRYLLSDQATWKVVHTEYFRSR